MINETRHVSIFYIFSRIDLGGGWKTGNSSSFFSKGRLDQRITRVIRGTHPFLPPVSPEQILAFHLHPCPAGRLRHRLNTNRNAAVYQSRIDTGPSLRIVGAIQFDAMKFDRKKLFVVRRALSSPRPTQPQFFPPPIFMRVTCYARAEGGGDRAPDFSNTFSPGSETMRYSQTRQLFPRYLDYC